MSEPVWLDIDVVIAIHEEQLLEHGGGAGLRDRGLLESALDRARAKWHYEQAPLAALAAAHAYGLARNHPFIDGNKRTALLALYTFLGLNGIEFDAPEPDAAAMILALAAGEIDEPALARWVAEWTKEPE